MAIISGTTLKAGRLIIINESDWSTEESKLINSGDFSVTSLEDGKKLVICISNEDDDMEIFGNVDAISEGNINSNLYCCGDNEYRQFGLGDEIQQTSSLTQVGIDGSDWKTLICANWSIFVIKDNGTLWACGFNGWGQGSSHLGLGDSDHRSYFTQVGNDTDWKSASLGSFSQSLAIKIDGTLWGSGYNADYNFGLPHNNNLNTFTQISSDTDWKNCSCNDGSIYAIKTDGTLWVCGINWYGQLGLGDIVHRSVLTQVGTDTDWGITASCRSSVWAIKTNGTLWSCGNNDEGILGLNDKEYRSNFTKVGSDSNWKSVISGSSGYGSHIMALKTDRTLWSCGYNYRGQLGLGDTEGRSTLTQVGTDTDWKSVSCGDNHTLAIKTNGTLWSCGQNNYSQLCLGDIDNERSVLTQVGTDSDWRDSGCGDCYSFLIKNIQ